MTSAQDGKMFQSGQEICEENKFPSNVIEIMCVDFDELGKYSTSQDTEDTIGSPRVFDAEYLERREHECSVLSIDINPCSSQLEHTQIWAGC
jgi:hypothetical protein